LPDVLAKNLQCLDTIKAYVIIAGNFFAV